VLASLALVALLAIDYPLGSTWRCAGWGLPAALLVACVLAQQGRLRFPVALVALGDASYSLYLLHPYALKAIEKVIGPMDRLTGATAISCLLYLGAAAAMALCVYQYFERPLLRLMRRRLIGRWHGVRTGRVATATG
jgi:peptidoglycan/LPS O-acetylase OafA/YrhL